MTYIFSIEGNIGSGKSTLINLLKNKFINFVFLPEPIDVWNEIKDLNGVTILEKYYSDQQRYAFSFQMMAFITRLSQMKEAIKNSPDNSIIITERCLHTDREIFAKMLYDSGKIEFIEYSIYLKWFDYFIENNLSGIIYLKTTPDICSNRILLRNRKGEESIPLSYLTECHNYHENWINSSPTNKLILNGNIEQIYTEQILNFIKENS